MGSQRVGRSAVVVRVHAVLAVMALALVAVVGGLAGTASADDIYEIDERLIQAGFDQAYTSALLAHDSDDGVRIAVEYESHTDDEGAHAEEAARIAELVWRHMDGRVLAVDVSSNVEPSWAPGSLPPTISTGRLQLEQAYGERPPGLDDRDVETADEALEEFGQMYAEEEALLGGVLLFFGWLVSVAVAVGLTVLVMRSRRPAGSAWGQGPYGGQNEWSGQPWAAQQAWSGQQQWPASPQWPAQQQWSPSAAAPAPPEQRWDPRG